MSPAHYAVDALFERHMVDDVGGVAEGELELVAPHGEYAAVASRHRVYGCGEVGAVCRGSEVVHLIVGGNDGEAVVQQHGGAEDGLVEGASEFAVTAAGEEEVVAEAALTDEVLELAHGNGVVQPRVVLVPGVDDSAP